MTPDNDYGEPVPPYDADRTTLNRIASRYAGRMDTLELTEATRAQLAFDLGMLIGMCMRLLEGSPRRVT